MTNSKSSKKNSKKSSKNDRDAASTVDHKGQASYKYSMVLKGRGFVKDEGGKWHEVDENGNLIPDELVKPL